MKKKLSISIEEETLKQIEDYAASANFRNRSHVVEFAVTKMRKKNGGT